MELAASHRRSWLGLFPILLLVLSTSAGVRADGPLHLVKDINPGASTSAPFFMAEGSGRLFFAAATFSQGRELWTSDGTEAGTWLVKDFRPGTASSHPKDMVEVQGVLLFTVSDGVVGREWWTSDGTEAGTHLLKDIRPGLASGIQDGNPLNSNPAILFRDRLYFLADDGEHGAELWVTDGTEQGTALFKDINPGDAPGFPIGFVVVEDTLYFFARDAEHGSEVWASDGTAAGTHRVTDIVVGPGSSVNNPLGGVGDLFLFTADDGEHGTELWVTEGTEEGTRMVRDLAPGPAGSYPSSAVALPDALVFFAADGEHGSETWRSDGTEDGTYLLKDIFVGATGSATVNPIAVGEVVFWTAYEEAHGEELWRTDGTTEGTALVQDLRPGPDASYPGSLIAIGDTLLFVADDGVRGLGLWRLRADASQAVRVQALAVGAAGPGSYAEVGSRLFLAASDMVSGGEVRVGRTSIVTGHLDQAIEDLAGEVDALDLPQGLRSSLTAKLSAAAELAARHANPRAILSLLTTFQHEVLSNTPSPISSAAAAELLDFAREIGDALVDNRTRPGPAPGVQQGRNRLASRGQALSAR